MSPDILLVLSFFEQLTLDDQITAVNVIAHSLMESQNTHSLMIKDVEGVISDCPIFLYAVHGSRALDLAKTMEPAIAQMIKNREGKEKKL